MRDEYDFSGAVKNPFAGQFKDGYTFIIHHYDTNGGWDEVKFVKPGEIGLEIEKSMREYSVTELIKAGHL